jgi:hypothetical protein
VRLGARHRQRVGLRAVLRSGPHPVAESMLKPYLELSYAATLRNEVLAAIAKCAPGFDGSQVGGRWWRDRV